jgi:catechol 2,3-dioxygenase-like lactoylglutathione lyase family enzyme
MLRHVATEAKRLVSGLAVVYLIVRDMERSRAFYRDVLGIPLEGDGDWVEADLGGTRFALHDWYEGADEPNRSGIHLDFRVADLEEAVERVRAAGFEARETLRDEWGAACEIVDPDGYRVYLFQPPA